MLKYDTIMKKIFSIVIAASMVLGISSCQGFLDTVPTDSVVDVSALATVADAAVAVNGMYTLIKDGNIYGSDMVYLGDMRGDNLYPTSISGYGKTVYLYDYTETQSSYFGSLWGYYYKTINRANSLLAHIDELEAKTSADQAAKADYKGQAFAVRAFCYFDLARLYGYPYQKDKGASLGAIILEKPSAPSEVRVPRTTVADLYAQVEKDINAALPLLSRSKNTGHFNYWAGLMLKAKAALYKGDYATAFSAANEVVTQSPYALVSNADYKNYWGQEGASESILEFVLAMKNNIDDDMGFGCVYNALWFGESEAKGNVVPTLKWRNLFKDTPNDVRGQMIQYDDPKTGPKQTGRYWINKFCGNKDRNMSYRLNNSHIYRMSDAYLIAAEAALETGNTKTANDYLNAIRKRADPTASDVTATLDLIMTERQKEFIGEGDRFFDVMRRGGKFVRDMNVDPDDFGGGAGYQTTIDWNYFKVVMPIASTERLIHPELQQNPGYKD